MVVTIKPCNNTRSSYLDKRFAGLRVIPLQGLQVCSCISALKAFVERSHEVRFVTAV